MASEIKTSFEHPPIPCREMDWCAWREGSPESGPYGRGETEQTAVKDLITQERERENWDAWPEWEAWRDKPYVQAVKQAEEERGLLETGVWVAGVAVVVLVGAAVLHTLLLVAAAVSKFWQVTDLIRLW